MDIVVDRTAVLEIKATERIQPIHEAQLLTYLRLSTALGHMFALRDRAVVQAQ
jgi:GxxExxY protein